MSLPPTLIGMVTLWDDWPCSGPVLDVQFERTVGQVYFRDRIPNLQDLPGAFKLVEIAARSNFMIIYCKQHKLSASFPISQRFVETREPKTIPLMPPTMSGSSLQGVSDQMRTHLYSLILRAWHFSENRRMRRPLGAATWVLEPSSHASTRAHYLDENPNSHCTENAQLISKYPSMQQMVHHMDDGENMLALRRPEPRCECRLSPTLLRTHEDGAIVNPKDTRPGCPGPLPTERQPAKPQGSSFTCVQVLDPSPITIYLLK